MTERRAGRSPRWASTGRRLFPARWERSRGLGEPTRIGLFGSLGSGNIGNDASMESMLGFLRSAHPDAVIDAMCTGPEQVHLRYGLEAEPLFWYLGLGRPHRGPVAAALKSFSKLIDIARIANWVRRHDAVIVPGMGVLETTLPLRAFGAPYAMFVMCLSGRLFGTKVALASVGANVIRQRLIRWMYHNAARLATYVSYRDAGSMMAMPARVPIKRIYADLAFGLPAATVDPGDERIVGVGVMDFHGTNDDRDQAKRIYASYVDVVTRFVLWLADTHHQVRLFVGDTKGSDQFVIDEILAQVSLQRPDLPPGQVNAPAVESSTDLMEAMAPAGAVVATRYHNLICALRLAKPTISLGYADKHDTLMATFGLSEYCQHAAALDLDQLIAQFTDLSDRSAELRQALADRNRELATKMAGQFAALSALLVPPPIGWMRGRDEIAAAIGAPVLASIRVAHPSDAGGWARLLENYEPTTTDTWSLRKALRQLGLAEGREPGHPQVTVAVISLSSDRRALALGPQLATFATALGIPTKLVVGQQQESGYTSALSAGCAMIATALSDQPNRLQFGAEESDESDRYAPAVLTVIVEVVDSREPRFSHFRATATVLGVTAGAATAEQLARVAVGVAASGRDISGALVANPLPSDRTTGSLPQRRRGPAYTRQHSRGGTTVETQR